MKLYKMEPNICSFMNNTLLGKTIQQTATRWANGEESQEIKGKIGVFVMIFLQYHSKAVAFRRNIKHSGEWSIVDLDTGEILYRHEGDERSDRKRTGL